MTRHSSKDSTVSQAPEARRRAARLAQRAQAQLSAASQRIGDGIDSVANLVKFEVIVTIVCTFIPIILITGDNFNVREHISGYYAMDKAQYFYVPLTVAAMLFLVNGVVKKEHWYNVGLGLALAGVVLFNHVDHSILHNVSAGTFFVGNAAVFVIFTPKKELWFKLLLATAVIAGLAGYFVFAWYSLFLAESVSLWIIAFHFVLEAKGLIG
ncbi:MAG: hypothetical protein L0271_21445 [Gemmatimonadetes bacterium]|nr:hypothetical protein [Gemmatimonadota bacterium]